MTRTFNPPHLGLTLRDDVLPALGLNVTQDADRLGVLRVYGCQSRAPATCGKPSSDSSWHR
jgi:hypothetical protein